MVTKEDIIERAKKISHFAAEQAEEAEQLCRLTDSLIDRLISEQLFSIVTPKKHNGLEMDLDVLLEAAKEVAQGCGSCGWVMSLLGTHNWMASLFPEQAQKEMFDGKGYVLAPGIFAPGGTAHKVEGGYQISGCWPFASGVRHSNWVLVSALEMDDQENLAGMYCCALPIEDVEILPTWDTSGMRGTGSCDVKIKEAFVPAHHTIQFSDLLNGTTEGAKNSANPMRRLPLIVYLAYTAVAPVIGMGKGALTVYRDHLKQRLYVSGQEQKNNPASQVRLARAQNQIDAAEALVDQGLKSVIQSIKDGETLTINDRVKYRTQACYAANMIKQAVNHMAEGAGAKAQFKSHPLQRFQRDINTISGHVVFDMDTTMELQGRVLLGLEPNHPLL